MKTFRSLFCPILNQSIVSLSPIFSCLCSVQSVINLDPQVLARMLVKTQASRSQV